MVASLSQSVFAMLGCQHRVPCSGEHAAQKLAQCRLIVNDQDGFGGHG
jgi:hypothetical protein